jgi:hypothetical protein
MDPIHPILPTPVNIPPILPSTGAGKINRDGGRDGGAEQQAKRDAKRRRQESLPDGGGEDEMGTGTHVDVTA